MWFFRRISSNYVAKKIQEAYGQFQIDYKKVIVGADIRPVVKDRVASLVQMIKEMGCVDTNPIYVVPDEEVNFENPNKAAELGVGMVHQHFKLVDTLTVAENIILGQEIKNGVVLDIKTAEKRIKEVTTKYNFDIQPTDLVGSLSVGQKQKVEISKML